MNEFEELIADLDHLADAPTGRLQEAVRQHGVCMWLGVAVDGPEWTGDDRIDRKTVARFCAECRVADECTELGFRSDGFAAFGLWGVVPPDQRRAAYLAWQARRDGGQR